MQYMERVLRDESIPEDCGVAIEYQLPQTAKRIDFILTGIGEDKTEYCIIVELKQWSEAILSSKDAIVKQGLGNTWRVYTSVLPSLVLCEFVMQF
jgi:hypothetical protein